MIWHGGFPLFVLGYGLTRSNSGDPEITWPPGRAIFASIVAIAATMLGLAWIVTAGNDLLPVLLSHGRYTTVMLAVVSTVWALSLAALLVLWFRRLRSVIDIWLMVVLY